MPGGKPPSKPKKPVRAAKPRALPAYRPQITDAILKRIAEGESLRSVCRDPKMPAQSTVFGWLQDEAKAAFRDAYEVACEQRAEAIFEDMLTIADDASEDFVGTDAGQKLDTEHVQRSKLRIETRKWMLARMAPKKYGDRLDLNHAGKDGGPLTVEIVRFGEPAA